MKSIITILIFAGLFFSCENSTPENSKSKEVFKKENLIPSQVSEKVKNASGPFFTSDQNGKSVLVWTEAVSDDSKLGNVIKFARLKSDGISFEKIQEVTTSKGCRQHDESMSKLAFKKDGTIVAVYSKRTPSEKNRFAGALFYTQSFDGGNEWTESNYLHVGDTTLGLSRSFFDLTTLPDGEVGAIWLDSRLTKKRGEGSSLFFSKTNDKDGFLTDQVIAKGTCECCRTDLFVSKEGKIHAIYRDILEGSIRDMVHLSSSDNGKTFTQPNRISQDDWVINGCPHTGPSMGETSIGLHYAWFTQGGGAGIYYTFSGKNGEEYAPRKLLTAQGQHPQLLALENEKVIFVWEEKENQAKNPGGGHGNHDAPKEEEQSENATQKTSFIKAQIWGGGNPLQEIWVSLPEQIGEYPVITDLGENEIGVAWVQGYEENKFGIFYKKIKI